ALDLFVLPSLWEGLSIVLLEAMAAGRPIVATAVGGTPELLQDGETGLLVPPADPVALGTAVNRLLADRAKAQQLGAAGRARMLRHFTVDQMVRQIEQLYEEVLGERVTR
ncbi:MAG: glycosyltransferase, partial [Anaerolineae bacterium]